MDSRFSPLLPLVLRVLAVAFLPSCSLHRSLTDSPPTAFLASSGAPAHHRLARLPFDQAWMAPKLDFSRYDKIVIKPVTLDYLRTEGWAQSASLQMATRRAYLEEARGVADSWNKSLHKAFSGKQSPMRPADDPKVPGTVVAEIALTEIVFSHPETYAASMAWAGGMLAEGVLFGPTVAFEAKLHDGPTGRLIATAADRAGTRIKIVDFNRLTVSRANKEICDDWSREMVEALNKKRFPVVRRRFFGLF